MIGGCIIILIKRSIYIIIYYVTVAAFSCLSFSSLVVSFEKTGSLPDGLSSESLQITIQSSDEASISNVTTGSFIKTIKEMTNTPFVMHKDTGTPNGKEFYVYKKKLPLVNYKPISNNTAIIYLDTSLKNNSISMDGKNYFIYKNTTYEVVGTYKRQRKNINQNSAFFASMDVNAGITGSYYIDGISSEDMFRVMEKLRNDDTSIEVGVVPMRQTLKERMTLVVKDQTVVIILLVITFFLIGISTIGTTMGWINSRKDEIYARYLVGGTFKNIQWWLLKDYWMILLVSFTIGLFISYIIIKINIFNYVVNEIDIYGILFAFIFCFILGTLTELISSLWDYRKKETIRKGY